MNLHNKSIAAILNNLSDAFMIMDDNGRINYFNDIATLITGYKNVEVMGMLCKDLLRTEYCNKCCLFNSQNITPKNYKRKLEITHKNGTKIPVECTSSILVDSAGLMFGAVEIFKDISQIKHLENSLKYSEFKYRLLFESTKDMVFIVSLDGEFIDINQAMADLLGYSGKEDLYLLNNIERIFIDPIHWNVCKKQIGLNGFIQDFEVGFKKKDGTRLHGCLSANVFLDNNGHIIGYQGIAKDITARMDSFRNLYKRHQELLLLNTVALAINSSQNLGDVLPHALNEVMKLLNFSTGAIFLINNDKEVTFELHTQKGLPKRIYTTQAKPIFHDTQLMDFFLKNDARLTPKSIFPSFKITLANHDKKNPIILSCFLITEKEYPSGFMAFPEKETDNLSLEDFHLLGSLGNFLGGAIANIKLIQTVQQHREDLKRLTSLLFQSKEIERKRIARELHDETGSSLIGINFNLETLEKIMPSDDPAIKNIFDNITRQINHTYQEMRRISHLLHPALLTDLGLEPALDSYLNRIHKKTSLHIDFKMIGFTGRIDPDIETVLYRFSQEALSNTIKYAKATVFKLFIIRGYPSIIFIAEDNGIGFNPVENNHEKPSLGLLSMRERTVILDGKFSLRSEKGKGTHIRIEIPMKNNELSLFNRSF